jgi:hypothetical protein
LQSRGDQLQDLRTGVLVPERIELFGSPIIEDWFGDSTSFLYKLKRGKRVSFNVNRPRLKDEYL